MSKLNPRDAVIVVCNCVYSCVVLLSGVVLFVCVVCGRCPEREADGGTRDDHRARTLLRPAQVGPYFRSPSARALLRSRG